MNTEKKKLLEKNTYDIQDLLNIMEILRAPDGCPWDRQQTHHSIRNNFIEETYEAIEAIDKEDVSLLKEELGDVLLQVVFHSQIENENGNFDFNSVCHDICEKLINRHPHIFRNLSAHETSTVLKNWENIKNEAKGYKNTTETLYAVPLTLPALMRAQKVQKRASKSGFDYIVMEEALSDLKSEIAELELAIKNNDIANIEEELGDVIFASVNVARFKNLDSEEALSKSTDKFISRFDLVEKIALKRNIRIKTAGIEILNEIWKEAKKQT